MAGKRQAKKNQKTQQRKVLTGLGYSKKQQRKISQSEYYLITKDLPEKQRIATKYNLNLDWSQPVSKFRSERAKLNRAKKEEAERKKREAELAKKAKKRASQKRYNDKKKTLMNELGLSGSPSKYSLQDLHRLKEEKVTTKAGKVYEFPYYLYIGFVDTAKEIDILDTQYYLQNLSTAELRRYINETMVYFNVDESSGRAGDIIIWNRVADLQYFVLTEVRHNEKRGYQTILTNKFTVRGGLILLQALIENCRESQRGYILGKLSAYFQRIPEFYEAWSRGLKFDEYMI